MGLVLFHLCHTLAGIAQYKMTPLSFARDPVVLLERSTQYAITLLGMPNFGFDQVLRAAHHAPATNWNLSTVKLIYNGAEPIDPALCRRFIHFFAPFGLSKHVISPGWGIAEASVAATSFGTSQLGQYDGIPSLWVSGLQGMHIGHPIKLAQAGEEGSSELTALGPPMTGLQVRVLDDDGKTLAPSCLGHLEIRGPNVSTAYYDGEDHEWCPSGDLGFVHQGIVYLTGRAKDVIFLNGRNFYSNDIETALCNALNFPANHLAVVGFHDPQRRVEQMVIFFRYERGVDREKLAAKLRISLEKQLAYPVMAAIGLAALPKTTSGKIRRFALRQALLRGDYAQELNQSSVQYQRPYQHREGDIAGLLAPLLQLNVGALDPDLPLSRFGLDSVGFMQLAFRLQQHYGIAFSALEVVRAENLAGIAQLVDFAMTRKVNATPRGMSGSRVPLTARQKMLWTASLLEPEGTTYHETYWLRLKGQLDQERYLHAAKDVIAAHPMLHAIVDDQQELALELAVSRGCDVSAHHCHASETDLILQRASLQTFDLRRGPLIRLKLCTDELGQTVWISAHHIITDGWSLHQLLSQIFNVYMGAEPPSQEAQLWFDEPDFAAETVKHWQSLIANAQAVLLPGHSDGFLRGATQTNTRCLSTSTARAVSNWKLQHGSEFSALSSVLLYLLARLGKVAQPLIGTIASGRVADYAHNKHGYFALSLPLAVCIDESDSFTTLVQRGEQYRLDLIAGQIPDLATLALNTQADLANKIRVVYVHQNIPEIVLPTGFQVEAEGRYRGAARTDLCVSSYWKNGRLLLDWDYDASMFSEAQIASYSELFEHLLIQMLAEPQRKLIQLDMLSMGQRALWQPYHHTQKEIDFTASIAARFDACVAQYAQSPALADGLNHYSYRELSEQVDHVCRQLEEGGIARGARVVLATDRSADYVIALLACLKMACVAVPIDPALPVVRVRQIAQDCQAALILTSRNTNLDAQLRRDFSVQCLGTPDSSVLPHMGRDPQANEPAYIIYTSGSTGQPKGVLNSHGSLINMIAWVVDDFAYRAGETICQFAPFSFDVSLAEILPSLCAGLYVHILSDERRASPVLYLESMRQNKINIATITPAYLAVLNEEQEICRASLSQLRLIILGGEALKTEDVRRFRQHSPHVRIMNVYGPTETTVLSSAYPVPDNLTDGRFWQPLGTAIANTEFWILDEHDRVCPATVSGTLFIGGAGVSLGYWQDQQKTEHAFRLLSPDGAAPRRLYCSGDLARLSLDGQIEFIGRADTQIKLRGFRIELSEIASVLEQHEMIQTALVTAPVRPSHSSAEEGERVLVAYYSGQAQAHKTLDAFVSARLPGHMRPSFYVHVPEWPLTANRKIDIKALPAPDWRGNLAHEGQGLDVDVTPTEQQLSLIWAELLGLDAIGRHDNFALLGGSSLSAAQLVNRIREKMGRDLPLIEILRHPELAEMALCIEKAPHAQQQSPSRVECDVEEAHVASEAQARMVFLERAYPGTGLNNMPLTLALNKQLDYTRLQGGAQQLLERHSLLRCSLQMQASGLMQAHQSALSVDVQLLIVQGEVDALATLSRFHAQAFDLEQGPLWRLALVRMEGQQDWLALCLHHAIADGITLVRLLSELDALYQQQHLADNSTELRYIDYVHWQEQWLASELGRKAHHYWATPSHHFPALALPETGAQASMVRGHQFTCDLTPDQTNKLKQLCRQNLVSPFALMISLFGFVLGQRCDANQFALGITFSGRSHHSFETVPGLFVNTLPLAFEWTAKESLNELLQRTKMRIGALHSIQDFPLNRAMAAMQVRDLPFNVLFNEEVLPTQLSFGGSPARLEGISTGIAKFPLLISFLFGGEFWRWRVEVREHGCGQLWINDLMQDLRALIDQIDSDNIKRLEELQTPDEALMALLQLKSTPSS